MPPTSTRRRTLRWLLPAFAVLAWLAIGGVAGPFAGKLATVQNNDSTAFLPSSAESTQVAELQRNFVDTTTVPAVIVAERGGGLTDADRGHLEELTRTLPDVEGIVGPARSPT